MPGGCSSGGKNSGSTLATATRAFGTRMRTFCDEAKFPGHENRGGLALFGGGEVSVLLGERQVAGPGAVGRCETGQVHRAVAEDFALEFFGDLGSSEWHGVMG